MTSIMFASLDTKPQTAKVIVEAICGLPKGGAEFAGPENNGSKKDQRLKIAGAKECRT